MADLMVGKLKSAAERKQQALQLLACLGNRAEFALRRNGFPTVHERRNVRPVLGSYQDWIGFPIG